MNPTLDAHKQGLGAHRCPMSYFWSVLRWRQGCNLMDDNEVDMFFHMHHSVAGLQVMCF